MAGSSSSRLRSASSRTRRSAWPVRRRTVGQRRAVAHGAQERDDVADDVPVGIHEPARRLRHHVGAERGQEIEDPPPPDADLLLDEHLEQAPDRAGAEQADQPDRAPGPGVAPREAARTDSVSGPARCSIWRRIAARVGSGHGLVGGQARHALDGERGLVERAAGQRALDQLVEPREDGRRLLVLSSGRGGRRASRRAAGPPRPP